MEVLDFTQTNKQINKQHREGGKQMEALDFTQTNKKHREGGKPMEVLDFIQTNK